MFFVNKINCHPLDLNMDGNSRVTLPAVVSGSLRLQSFELHMRAEQLVLCCVGGCIACFILRQLPSHNQLVVSGKICSYNVYCIVITHVSPLDCLPGEVRALCVQYVKLATARVEEILSAEPRTLRPTL